MVRGAHVRRLLTARQAGRGDRDPRSRTEAPMSHTNPTLRITGIHLDYATWHNHLAARAAAPRLVVVPHRSTHRARPAHAGRILALDLATWQVQLAGSTRRAS